MGILNRAIKATESFVWYIQYIDMNCEIKLTTVYADTAKKAVKAANKKLREMYGNWYTIKSISTV